MRRVNDAANTSPAISGESRIAQRCLYYATCLIGRSTVRRVSDAANRSPVYQRCESRIALAIQVVLPAIKGKLIVRRV